MDLAVVRTRVFVLRSIPIRNLFWGLVCFSILMFFVAWGGIGTLFVPPTPGEGVRLIDMPAPLAALSLALCLLPLAAVLLILAGISWMVIRVPGIGPRLTWRLKGVDIAASDVGIFMVLAAAVVYFGFFFAANARVPGSAPAIGALSFAIVLGAVPIALGWYLLFVSGWALAPLATRQEQIAILTAVSCSGLFAALLIGAGLGATLAAGSAALEPDAAIPPPVPWASAASGVAGFAALVVLTVLARRIARRFEATRPAVRGQPG